jgi:predicted lipase
MIANINLRGAEACAGSYAAGAIEQWQGRDNRVHAYLSMVDGVHAITHEGTTDWTDRSSLAEWLIDFDAYPVLSPGGVYGYVHRGMLLDVLSIADQLEDYLSRLGWPDYVLFGHSKGGGEVTLEAAEMKRRGHPPAAVRAYEPPQVGGIALRDYLSDVDYAWTCTTNARGRDVITRVPEGLQLPYLTDWSHINDAIVLTVPDALDAIAKHKIPAVIAALAPLAV